MKVKCIYGGEFLNAIGIIKERGYFNYCGEECFKIRWEDGENRIKANPWFHPQFLKIIKHNTLRGLIEN